MMRNKHFIYVLPLPSQKNTLSYSQFINCSFPYSHLKVTTKKDYEKQNILSILFSFFVLPQKRCYLSLTPSSKLDSILEINNCAFSLDYIILDIVGKQSIKKIGNFHTHSFY